MKSALCFFLMMLLALCPALAEAAEDPVVVRVGDVTFTKSQLESAVDTDVTITEMMSQKYLTDEEKLGQRDETIQRFIGVGLIEMKLRDAGKNDFTDEEEESLRATAMSQYEAMWQGIWQRAQQSDQGFTEDQVTEFMQEQGYTSEAIFEELKANERRHRAVEILSCVLSWVWENNAFFPKLCYGKTDTNSSKMEEVYHVEYPESSAWR